MMPIKGTFSIILFFIFYSSFAQQDANIKCYVQIKKETKMLNKVEFNKAIKKLGNAFEQHSYTVQAKELPSILSSKTIAKHYKHTKDAASIIILEASFKRCNGSFITVYYKQKNRKWLPLESLVSL